MASIEKRGQKFQVRWWSLTGVQKKRSCPTLRDAKTLQREVESSLALGREWQPAITGAEPTIEEVAKAYIERRSLTVRPDTLRMDGTYLDVFNRFVATKSRRPAVSMLSKPLLDEYMAWLARPETTVHGKKAREPETIAKFVRAAQLMWKWSEDSDRWPGMIPRPRTVQDLPRSAPQPVVAPSWAEMDACVLACNGWQRKLATWLRYTGLRSGESMLVVWTDIDVARGLLTIRPEIDKNGVGRVVPLSPYLLDEIATWGKREGFVIPSGRRPGERHREARGRDMARAWRRAGVREAVYRRRPDHAFRKGFKSNLLGLGAHPDALDFLQGHCFGAGSRGRYIDPAQLPLVEVVRLIPAIDGSRSNVVALPQPHTRNDGASAA